jgi:hypothetical protein
MPAFRFADLKIKTRNTGHFGKHFGVTASNDQKLPSEFQREKQNAQSERDSDEPVEGCCDKGREPRHDDLKSEDSQTNPA